MEQKYYYYNADGILAEEVTIDEIRDMVETGELDVSNLVCETKTQQWQSVSDLLNQHIQPDNVERPKHASYRRRSRSSGKIEQVPLSGIWLLMGIGQIIICMLYALSVDDISRTSRILIVLCSLPAFAVCLTIGLICKTCQTYLSSRK